MTCLKIKEAAQKLGHERPLLGKAKHWALHKINTVHKN